MELSRLRIVTFSPKQEEGGNREEEHTDNPARRKSIILRSGVKRVISTEGSPQLQLSHSIRYAHLRFASGNSAISNISSESNVRVMVGT